MLAENDYEDNVADNKQLSAFCWPIALPEPLTLIVELAVAGWLMIMVISHRAHVTRHASV